MLVRRTERSSITRRIVDVPAPGGGPGRPAEGEGGLGRLDPADPGGGGDADVPTRAPGSGGIAAVGGAADRAGSSVSIAITVSPIRNACPVVSVVDPVILLPPTYTPFVDSRSLRTTPPSASSTLA